MPPVTPPPSNWRRTALSLYAHPARQSHSTLLGCSKRRHYASTGRARQIAAALQLAHPSSVAIASAPVHAPGPAVDSAPVVTQGSSLAIDFHARASSAAPPPAYHEVMLAVADAEDTKTALLAESVCQPESTSSALQRLAQRNEALLQQHAQIAATSQPPVQQSPPVQSAQAARAALQPPAARSHPPSRDHAEVDNGQASKPAPAPDAGSATGSAVLQRLAQRNQALLQQHVELATEPAKLPAQSQAPAPGPAQSQLQPQPQATLQRLAERNDALLRQNAEAAAASHLRPKVGSIKHRVAQFEAAAEASAGTRPPRATGADPGAPPGPGDGQVTRINALFERQRQLLEQHDRLATTRVDRIKGSAWYVPPRPVDISKFQLQQQQQLHHQQQRLLAQQQAAVDIELSDWEQSFSASTGAAEAAAPSAQMARLAAKERSFAAGGAHSAGPGAPLSLEDLDTSGARPGPVAAGAAPRQGGGRLQFLGRSAGPAVDLLASVSEANSLDIDSFPDARANHIPVAAWANSPAINRRVQDQDNAVLDALFSRSTDASASADPLAGSGFEAMTPSRVQPVDIRAMMD